MSVAERSLSRRDLFRTLGLATGGITVGRWLGPRAVMGQEPAKAIETFTGPGAN